MQTLALVAITARALAQAAARDGYRAVAIDTFGDLDTRRACARWLPAGEPDSLRIDPARVLAHLHELAREPDVVGWVAGSGCEAHTDLLREGAAVLPMIGCPPQAVQRVREPEGFFAWLRSHGLQHPEVRFSPPRERQGWLVKDADGCGGWHVRPAEELPGGVPPGHYLQRRVPGVPMSATFCANGSDALLMGFNLALPHSSGVPFMYGGLLGPVDLPPAVATQLSRAVRLLGQDLGLRGLGSLDFIFDGSTAHILEVNPRPSCSMSLYAHRIQGGLMNAQVQACLHGQLPGLRPVDPTQAVLGESIVYAPRAMTIDATVSLGLQGRAECLDLPAAGVRLNEGDPLCSVSASGPDAASVRLQLQQRHDAVLKLTESLP